MNVICRFATAIGYPQTVPAEREEFTFVVDGGEMRALDLGGRLVLTREISCEEEAVPRLAAYSPGRLLRESATLYWDVRCGAVKLAQEIPADATERELKVFFESFADSCDWWLARAASEPAAPVSFPGMAIRP